METKLVRVPFDLELAKRIVNKEVDGKIITGDGRNVRVICWDSKAERDYPIIALIEDGKKELVYSYRLNGNYNSAPSNETAKLVLEVPGYMTFKVGDVIYTKGDNEWIFIYTGFDIDVFMLKMYFCAALVVNLAMIIFGGPLNDDAKSNAYRLATEEEKQKLIDALKGSSDKLAKVYLKQFFGIEEKQEFKPFDKVLVRTAENTIWEARFFNRMYGDLYTCTDSCRYKECIPYNEQTAHLLGTTENYE